jgi:glycopeptide antibiotics resistance protein
LAFFYKQNQTSVLSKYIICRKMLCHSKFRVNARGDSMICEVQYLSIQIVPYNSKSFDTCFSLLPGKHSCLCS